MKLVLVGLVMVSIGNTTDRSTTKGSIILTFRLPSWVNCLRQSSNLQMYGLCCSCTILCARTFPRCANRLPQMSQW